MEAKINKTIVDLLVAGSLFDEHGEPVTFVADSETKGFNARKLKSGTITYGVKYRNAEGLQRWLSLGTHGETTPDIARRVAKQRLGEIAAGRDPAGEKETARRAERNSVDAVLDAYLKRQVHGRELRTAGKIERNFERLVRPQIGAMSVYDVKRRDLIRLLDDIEDSSGAPMADQVLSNLHSVFTWWAGRDEDFASPIVAGMQRTKPKDLARDRNLDAQDLRDLNAVLDEAVSPAAARFMRFLLYSGQRTGDEVGGMHAREVAGNIWTIPGSRYKTKVDHVVPLSPALVALLPTGRTGYLFSNNGGRTPFGRSRVKAAIDAAIAELRKAEGREPMPAWQFRDLRRTARSLMSKIATPDIAERTIGHKIGGIRGVYDKFEYLEEKRACLEALAGLLDRILHPAANVTELRRSSEAAERNLAVPKTA